MCPFAQRTWIALEESGLAYDLEEVSLYGAGGKPGWFMKLNPKGQVPVLVVGDDVTAESERTIDAVAALHQGGGSGGAAAAAAEVAWRTRISDTLLPRGKKCVLSGDRAGVEALLESLEPEVVGPFLCGENFGGADISAAPFIQRLESEYGIPESCPRLREWYSNISRRPSVKATIRRSWWWWW
jgi:glutathione S-transferase